MTESKQQDREADLCWWAGKGFFQDPSLHATGFACHASSPGSIHGTGKIICADPYSSGVDLVWSKRAPDNFQNCLGRKGGGAGGGRSGTSHLIWLYRSPQVHFTHKFQCHKWHYWDHLLYSLLDTLHYQGSRSHEGIADFTYATYIRCMRVSQ